MNKKYKNFIFAVVLLLLCGISGSARAGENSSSPISGDPSIRWDIIGNNEKVKNNAYERCMLIRSILPGQGKSAETVRNNYDIMSKYVSYLYTQSVMISVNIAAEEQAKKKSGADKSNQVELLKQEINGHLGNITRRINIINSLEAGVTMLELLNKMRDLPSNTYSSFKLPDGDVGYDCEVLK